MQISDVHNRASLNLGGLSFYLNKILAGELEKRRVIYKSGEDNGSVSYSLNPSYRIVLFPETGVVIIEDYSGEFITCFSFSEKEESPVDSRYIITIPRNCYLRFLELALMCGIRDFYPAEPPNVNGDDAEYKDGTSIYTPSNSETLAEELYALGILSMGGYTRAETLGYRMPKWDEINNKKLYSLALANYVLQILGEKPVMGEERETLLELLNAGKNAGMDGRLLDELSRKLNLI